MIDGLPLPHLSASAIEAVARTLYIVDHKTGARILWRPNVEQRRAWEAAETGAAMVLKPRGIGISTAYDLDDLLWTMIADVEGHTVRTTIFLDTDAKTKERIRQIRDFMKQLNLAEKGRPNEHKIMLPRSGAEILAVTAAGDRPMASLQSQRVRWSERCFYPAGAMAAAGMSVGLAAREVVETTVSPDGDSFAECRAEWRNPRSKFTRLFLSVEMHDEYRLDPASISDEEYERMQREGGYADRSAAAWFLVEGVRRCGHDEAKAWHELPNLERHMWQAGAGRVFKRTPDHSISIPELGVTLPGRGGDLWRFDVYGRAVADGRLEPFKHCGQVVVTIDTARGVEVTRSVVTAIDKRDRIILGSFCSGSVGYDDLAAMGAAAKDHFGPGTTLVVEDDGVGDATCQALDRLGVAYVRFRQATIYQDRITGNKTTNRARCITAATNAVNQSLERAPPEMCAECDALVKNERGALVGLKDFVMTYGMALVHTEDFPYNEQHALRAYEKRATFNEDLRAYLATRAMDRRDR